MRSDFFLRRLKLIFSLRKKKVRDHGVGSSARIHKNVRIYVGKKCTSFILSNKVQIRRSVDIEAGGALFIGESSVIGVGSYIQADGIVKIGKGALLGPYVKIFSSTHNFGRNGEIHEPLIKGEVNIGNNVWIGTGVVIAVGTTIGDNSVIGANSFVNTDIPSNSVAVGSPAKVTKYF